jgi:large subunit ribosomal protein L29
MKMKDIKVLSVNELQEKILSLKKDLFDILKQKSFGQFDNVYHIKKIKKSIARIKTFLNSSNNHLNVK